MTVTQADLDAAQADILAKVNDRFAALGKLVPVPPPPPPPSNRIYFASHRFYLGGPKPQADFYDLQQGPGLLLTDFFPAETYRYATTARSLQDPDGYRQLLPPSQTGAANYLVPASGGGVVHRSSNGDSLLNISSPALMAGIVANLQALTKGFNGLSLDEVDETWAYGYPGYSTTGIWTTPQQWADAMVTFVGAIASRLHTLGKKLWINASTVGNEPTNPFLTAVTNAADGVNIEFFAVLPGGAMMTGTRFLQSVDRLAVIESAGKEGHAHVPTASQLVTDYGFGAYLLGTLFHGSFTSSSDNSGAFTKPSPDLLTAAQALGQPKTGRFLAAGTGYATRNFQAGTVTVNHTGTAGTLPVGGVRIQKVITSVAP